MKPEEVDVPDALQMIRVGIVPTDEIDPVGTVINLHGDIPVRLLEEKTREEFLAAVKKCGLPVGEFAKCPAEFKFQAIEAVHRANKPS